MNTINDLVRIVHGRLQPLHGMWVEDPDKFDIGMMLGITDEFPTKVSDVTDTILDPTHPFWSDYPRDVIGFTYTEKEVSVAITMLEDEGLFDVRDDTENDHGAYIHVGSLHTERTTTLPEKDEIAFTSNTEGSTLIMEVTTDSGVYYTTLYRQ